LKQYPLPVVAAALVASALGLSSCVDHRPAAREARAPRVAFAGALGTLGDVIRPSRANDGRVILVTLDGVRAEDVFGGADPSLRRNVDVAQLTRPEQLMPRTHALVATRGVALGQDRRGCGTVRTASGANVSLPGYLEIFTGRKTLCRDNGCPRTERATVLDEAADAGLTAASIGSWNVLDHAVSRGNPGVFVQVGTHRWPGPRPLADARLEQLAFAGEHAGPFPGVGGYRPDAATAPIALHTLKDAPPAVFHIGLGDADEWAHRDDYAAYLGAIGKADAFIGQLADTLDTMGEVGARTTVIVTTDHGRNSDFRHHGAYSASSGRSFVLAFGGRVPVQGVACPSRDVTLIDIAPTIRALVGLPADASRDAGRAIAEIVSRPDLAQR
jgi:Metalloenzyme superfamily